MGKAGYANPGAYFSAFFGFANGLERLAKCVCAIDLYLKTGSMPTDKELRDYGHDIVSLCSSLDEVVDRRSLNLEFTRPAGAIVDAVLDHYDSFADAKRGRYANFALMNGGKKIDENPISLWWERVCPLILLDHFYGTPAELEAEKFSKIAEAAMGAHSIVFHTDESGAAILTMESSVWQARLNHVTQRYGRFYSLQWARWIADCFRQVVRQNNSDLVLAFQHEYLLTLLAPDEFLLNRSRWPL